MPRARSGAPRDRGGTPQTPGAEGRRVQTLNFKTCLFGCSGGGALNLVESESKDSLHIASTVWPRNIHFGSRRFPVIVKTKWHLRRPTIRSTRNWSLVSPCSRKSLPRGQGLKPKRNLAKAIPASRNELTLQNSSVRTSPVHRGRLYCAWACAHFRRRSTESLDFWFCSLS